MNFITKKTQKYFKNITKKIIRIKKSGWHFNRHVKMVDSRREQKGVGISKGGCILKI